MLTRLYDCQGGSILIDGYDIKEIDKKWLRKHVGLILQESFLFACSIKENIAFADPSITEEEIYEAARIASIHEAILEFEQGYDTPVGERGVSYLRPETENSYCQGFNKERSYFDFR